MNKKKVEEMTEIHKEKLDKLINEIVNNISKEDIIKLIEEDIKEKQNSCTICENCTKEQKKCNKYDKIKKNYKIGVENGR